MPRRNEVSDLASREGMSVQVWLSLSAGADGVVFQPVWSEPLRKHWLVRQLDSVGGSSVH